MSFLSPIIEYIGLYCHYLLIEAGDDEILPFLFHDDPQQRRYYYLVANQIHGVEIEILDALNYFKPSFFPSLREIL